MLILCHWYIACVSDMINSHVCILLCWIILNSCRVTLYECMFRYDKLRLLQYCLFELMIITATLWNRTGHYILPCGSFLSSSFFPRLISAVADWMSTIYTWCGLSANLECRSEMCFVTRWKYRTQKIAICAPLHNFVRRRPGGVGLWTLTRMCSITQTYATRHNPVKRKWLVCRNKSNE